LPESVHRLPARNLRVGVDIDRHEVADVHCLCSLVGAASRSAPDGCRRAALADTATQVDAAATFSAASAACHYSIGISQ
jgi:hypothetical protein